jgi:lipid-A-disaccharide synthase
VSDAERKQPKIMISAGEASGDTHAAHAIEALRAKGIEPKLLGMGGPKLEALGMELVLDARELAVVGIVEVLVQYRSILKKLNHLRDALRREKPDLLVCVDYPDFNLKLCETARECGVPVLFYVSPQVWAWRPKRVERIGKLVDVMAVLFPFEVDFYRKAGVPVRYVGNPLLDQVPQNPDRAALRTEFGVGDKPVLGLLPGSRRGEIQRLLPVMLESVRELIARVGPIDCLLPVAGTLPRELIAEPVEASRLPIRLLDGRAHDVIAASNAVLTASGTATLEVGLVGTPMAIVYRVQPITYFIMRRMMIINDIGLVNIVAGRRVVQEFLQGDAKPKLIADELQQLLQDADYAAQIRAELAQLREKMGEGGGAENVAALMAEMLADPKGTPQRILAAG